MYKKCKNLRYRSKKKTIYLYCAEKKKTIERNECFCCNYITFNKSVSNRLKIGLKSKSKKLNKMERNRESIITHDKTKCFICGSKRALTWHEIFRGRNRSNSIKYQLILRLCLNCHKLYQNNKEFNDYWHAHAQTIFEKKYPNENFIKIFHKNYKK